MNWFTKNHNVIVDSRDDRCDHLKDGDVAAFRTAEMDSFGPVDRYCMCEACYAEHIKNTNPRDLEGSAWLLDCLREAVKAGMREHHARADESPESAAFGQALKNAIGVGIHLKEVVISQKYDWEENPRIRTEYTPVFRIIGEDGTLTAMFESEERIWAWNVMGAEWINRLGEQLTNLTAFVDFDNAAGPFNLNIRDGYILTTHAVFNLDGNLLARYTWNKDKPATFEVRPLDDYDVVGCCDCKKSKFKYLTREWRWYDFYAPQGDEPMTICNECWTKPRHQERLARDRQELSEEMGWNNDDD